MFLNIEIFIVFLILYCINRYDSVITQRINYDLLKKIQKIVSNEISCPELLGTCISSKTNETIPAAVAKAEKVPM